MLVLEQLGRTPSVVAQGRRLPSRCYRTRRCGTPPRFVPVYYVAIKQSLVIQACMKNRNRKPPSSSAGAHTLIPCKDGSTCLKPNISGYGGNGHIAMANSPLPGLMMSLDQFKNAGVPIDRVVVGLPWCGLDLNRPPQCLNNSALTGLTGVLISGTGTTITAMPTRTPTQLARPATPA